MHLKINVKSVALYICYSAALVFLNFSIESVPLSIGLYFAMLACGANIFVTPVLYILSSVTYLNWLSSVLVIFQAAFLMLVTFLYRKFSKKMRIEAVAYLLIALAPYIIFAKWKGIDGINFLNNEYAVKSIAAVASIIFWFFCFKSIYALLFRIMRCRLREDELVCLAATFTAIGIGIYNLLGLFVYTSFAAGCISFFVRLSRSPSAIIAALVLALPPAICALDLTPVTAYVICAAAALLFSGAGRFFPSIITLALSTLYAYFTGSFECGVALIILRALLLLCANALPVVFTNSYLSNIKSKLLIKEVLPDSAIARSRRRTGEKLYRISEVFREIECAFCALDDNLNDSAARERILDELKQKCCKNCERAKRCARTNVYLGFKKLIDAGCVKGKVNLIDLPSELTLNCANPSDVMAKLNLLIAEYRRFMTETENARSGRELLADQARGIAEVMKSCSVELCKSYNEYTEYETAIKKKLSASGISCPELYISGDDMEVNAVIYGKSKIKEVTDIISDSLKRKYILKDKYEFGGDTCSYVFGVPPRLDAAFGVAYAIKNGEKVSGDTHSVTRINEHSFLMALSDGMGSGEYAKKISATAISLIEAFYRAEMPEGTVLKTINKLLSFNRDERFTCIDIAAVNLNSGIAEFVKIGSPAGVIMREGEIKVLESQSLPLGILDNLRPTVCTEQLRTGDIVVFMSDGITSAFSSSTELYEFLQQLRPLNPQNLADKILAGALGKTRSVADDMTVLCTRIFEKYPAE